MSIWDTQKKIGPKFSKNSEKSHKNGKSEKYSEIPKIPKLKIKHQALIIITSPKKMKKILKLKMLEPKH
jgi:ureidoglycolate hydrolase